MSALGQAGLQELAAGIQLNSGYSEASGRGVLTERGMSRGRDKGCLKREFLQEQEGPEACVASRFPEASVSSALRMPQRPRLLS